MSRKWYQLPPLCALCVSMTFLVHAGIAIQGLLQGWRVTIVLAVLAVTLPIGIGSWFCRAWARWSAIVVTTLMTVYQLYLMFGVELSWTRSKWLFSWLFVLWAAWYWDRDRNDNEMDSNESESDDPSTLISIVMLLREPMYLDDAILTSIVERAWGEALNESEGSFVVGQSPLFVLQSPPRMYMIHNRETPYFDDTESVAKEIPELRLKKAVRDHRAWMAVDLMSLSKKPSEGEVKLAYQQMGKLVATLANYQCCALMFPQHGKAFVYDSEMDQRLRSDSPLEGLNVFVPVIQVHSDDPEMAAAVDDARKHWPEFVAAFNSRSNEEQVFSIKAPISDGVFTEFMWVSVTKIDKDFVCGTLGNEPVEVSGVKLGDEIRVSCTDVNDWLYVLDDKPVGGFSLKVIAKREAGT